MNMQDSASLYERIGGVYSRATTYPAWDETGNSASSARILSGSISEPRRSKISIARVR